MVYLKYIMIDGSLKTTSEKEIPMKMVVKLRKNENEGWITKGNKNVNKCARVLRYGLS